MSKSERLVTVRKKDGSTYQRRQLVNDASTSSGKDATSKNIAKPKLKVSDPRYVEGISENDDEMTDQEWAETMDPIPESFDDEIRTVDGIRVWEPKSQEMRSDIDLPKTSNARIVASVTSATSSDAIPNGERTFMVSTSGRHHETSYLDQETGESINSGRISGYRIESAPEAAKIEYEYNVAQREIIEQRNVVDEERRRIEDELRPDTGSFSTSIARGIKPDIVPKDAQNLQKDEVQPVFAIYGSNKDGSEYYRVLISRDAEGDPQVVERTPAESRAYQQILPKIDGMKGNLVKVAESEQKLEDLASAQRSRLHDYRDATGIWL